jgi:glycosyltransferase involved in cell wall biosynthesis
MKIGIVTNTHSPRISGVSIYLEKLTRGLLDRGHQLLLVGPPGTVAQQGADAVEARGFPMPWYPQEFLSFLPPAFKQMLERFQPDVLNVVDPHVLNPLGAPAIRLGRKLGIPLVANIYTDFSTYYSFYGVSRAYQDFLRRLNLWIAAGSDLILGSAKWIAGEIGEATGRPALDAPPGVDLQLFHPSRRSDRMRVRLTGGRATELLLVFAGRLSREKSLDRILELRAPTNAAVAIVGEGPDRGRLEALATGKQVVFAGPMRGEELAEALASADGFLYPSTTETFGMAALESLACGVPVVVANQPGQRQFVRDGHNGLLFDPGDAGDFAAKALTLCRADVREAMRANCRASVLGWGWDSVVRRAEDGLRTAVEIRRNGGGAKERRGGLAGAAGEALGLFQAHGPLWMHKGVARGIEKWIAWSALA